MSIIPSLIKRKETCMMASTKKLLICTFIILTVALLAGLFPIHGESEIYDTVVRLHVLANSDSEEDQALKLKVRDRVIELVTPAVKDCKSQSEAEAAITEIMDDLESAARDVVAEEGYDYDVTLWEKHGVCAVGPTIMEAFDQVDVLNKSAQIYISAKNMGFEPDGMTKEQMQEMTVAFNLPK